MSELFDSLNSEADGEMFTNMSVLACQPRVIMGVPRDVEAARASERTLPPSESSLTRVSRLSLYGTKPPCRFSGGTASKLRPPAHVSGGPSRLAHEHGARRRTG